MFKNREFRVRVAKTDDAASTEEHRYTNLSDEDLKMVVNATKAVAMFVGGVWLTGKVIDGVCEIIIRKL